MIQKSGTEKRPAEAVIKDIRRATRKHYGAEEKIRIVLEGLRGEESIAALCRREGIAESLYYNWSKEYRRLRGSRFHSQRRSAPGHRRARLALFNENAVDDGARPVAARRRRAPTCVGEFVGSPSRAARRRLA
jgi:transposase-like protein